MLRGILQPYHFSVSFHPTTFILSRTRSRRRCSSHAAKGSNVFNTEMPKHAAYASHAGIGVQGAQRSCASAFLLPTVLLVPRAEATGCLDVELVAGAA